MRGSDHKTFRDSHDRVGSSSLGSLCRNHVPAHVLVTQGYDLMTAGIIITLMLLAGVGGQVMRGQISDSREKRVYDPRSCGTIPSFYLFFASTGLVSVISILLFGFFLWSTFAVAVAMSHELLPQNVGLASGMMLGLAIGFGGLGVAVNGIIADHYSLSAALGTIPVPIIAAMLIMFVLPYPWKSVSSRSVRRKET